MNVLCVDHCAGRRGHSNEATRHLSVLVRGGWQPTFKPNKLANEKKTVRTVALSSPERYRKRLSEVIHQVI